MQKVNGKDMSTVKMYVDEYLEQNAQEQIRKKNTIQSYEQNQETKKRVMTKCITTGFNLNPTPRVYFPSSKLGTMTGPNLTTFA